MSRRPAHHPAPPVRARRGPSARSVGVWWDAVLAVVGLVLPVACVGCGAADRGLCRSCRTDLDARPPRRRLVAGVRLDAAFGYEGLVRTLVLELKLRGRTDLAPALAGRFGELVRRALTDTPGAVLVRVPPSRDGARRRGFDPVVLLLRRSRVRVPHPFDPLGRSRARERSGRRRCPLAPWWAPLAGHRRATLRRVRPTPGAVRATAGPGETATGAGVAGGPGAAPAGHGQKERTALERVEATVGTLRAAGVTGRDVVVVDDVVTTGVTMAEAVRAVRAGGGRVVRCVALAEVDR